MHEKKTDRLALITGASRGIGATIAKAVAALGIHVVLTARTIGALEELDDSIKNAGGSSSLVPMDLLDFPAIDRLGARIYERWGKLDILISNAASLGEITPIYNYNPKTWEEVIGVNLTANQRLIRSLDPLLRRSKCGRAIFVSSGIIAQENPYWGAYAVSKSGLETMVKIYAKEIEKTGIKVNIVDPGVTRTNLRASAFPGENPKNLKPASDLVPMFLELISSNCQDHAKIIRFESFNTNF